MALIGINPARPSERGMSALEKIALGMQIADKALGIGLAIPEYIAKKKAMEVESAKNAIAMQVAQIALNKSNLEMTPVTPEEQQVFVKAGLPSAMIPRVRSEIAPAVTLMKTMEAAEMDRKRLGIQQAELKINQAKEAREAAKIVLTPGEEDMDKEFAKEYVDWNAKGGYATAQKNLQNARWATKELLDAQKNKKTYSGKWIGQLPDRVKAVVAPQAVDIEDRVGSVVVMSLRQALGPQFTEKEGTRILNQTFNPLMDEKVNAERLTLLTQSLERIFRLKEDAAQYWRINRTLKGWSGSAELKALKGAVGSGSRMNSDRDAEDF